MPRLKNDLELLKELQRGEKVVPVSPAVTAVGSAAAEEGDDTLTFAVLPAGFADKERIIIAGSGGVEMNEIAGAPAAELPLKTPLAYSHEAGFKIYKARVIDLGPLAEGGVQRTGQQQLTPVPIANSRVPLGYVKGTTTLGFSFGLMGENNLNLQTAFGIDEGETGTGTAADPFMAAIGGKNVGTHGLTCFRFTGILNDLSTLEFDVNGAQVAVNANHAIGATTPQAYTVAGNAGNFVQKLFQ